MQASARGRRVWLIAAIIAICVIDAPPAQAYIGPGAGFAFVSSFLAVLATFVLAFIQLFTWPIRWILRTWKQRKSLAKSRVKRVVVLGLDGQDPELTDQFLKEGILPNFAKLQERGSYVRLDTSFPAESPVAWSSFQTGCNPGKHKVFDFLVPNRKSHLPELCSAKVSQAGRTLKLGKYRLPIGKPTIDLGRKSQPFWKVLGDHGIFSTVLRVPITFPPEKFHGTLLSAMCVPDLKGSQGTFSFYSSQPEGEQPYTGGVRIPVQFVDGVMRSYISGPENTMVRDGGEMRLPFEVRLGGKSGADAEVILDKKAYPLKLREYSPWIEFQFRPALTFKVRGIGRFYLKQVEPHFELYLTPINIDPDKPALPISHPFTYAMYLAKTQGRYSTLGLAEDTWALNERVLDEEGWLKQAWGVHEERERMYFDALEKTRRGAVVCVFDITDRLQHMFWRYLEPDHPANAGKDTTKHAGAIRDLYLKMDDLVGRTMAQLKDGDMLMVMSDHGFKPFRRGVNLNAWLAQHGFLATKDGAKGEGWYQDVDWSRTQAYAVGLGGIYINLRGREAKGIVATEDVADLKRRIAEGLRELRDGSADSAPVADVYDTQKIYRGPYVAEAPDLFVGFNVGFRASWDCATGVVRGPVLEDNTKSWSGDHCMNPPDVPGIFFCSQKIPAERVNIMDIGPTVLDLFGVKVPAYCDGQPLIPAEGPSSQRGQASPTPPAQAPTTKKRRPRGQRGERAAGRGARA